MEGKQKVLRSRYDSVHSIKQNHLFIGTHTDISKTRVNILLKTDE